MMSTETKPPANTTQFNVRLPADLKARLENYARLVDRPQASVASDGGGVARRHAFGEGEGLEGGSGGVAGVVAFSKPGA